MEGGGNETQRKTFRPWSWKEKKTRHNRASAAVNLHGDKMSSNVKSEY